MTVLYVLQSLSIAEKFYLGVTNRMVERLNEHNRGKTRSTKKAKPWIIIYTEVYQDKSAAMKREYYLKSICGYKERIAIIHKHKITGGSKMAPSGDR